MMLRKLLTNHFALTFIFFFIISFLYRLYFHLKFPYLWLDEVLLKNLLIETPWYQFFIPGLKNHIVGGQSFYFLAMDIFWSFFHFNIHAVFLFNTLISFFIHFIFYRITLKYNFNYLSFTFINFFFVFNSSIVNYSIEAKQYYLELLITLFIIYRSNITKMMIILTPMFSLVGSLVLGIRLVLDRSIKKFFALLILLIFAYASLKINDPKRLAHMNYFWFGGAVNGAISFESFLPFVKKWINLMGREVKYVFISIILISFYDLKAEKNKLQFFFPVIFLSHLTLSYFKVFPILPLDFFINIESRIALYLLVPLILFMMKNSAKTLKIKSFLILYLLIFQILNIPQTHNEIYRFQTEINETRLFTIRMIEKFKIQKLCSDEEFNYLLSDAELKVEFFDLYKKKNKENCYLLSKNNDLNYLLSKYPEFEFIKVEATKFTSFGILKRKN